MANKVRGLGVFRRERKTKIESLRVERLTHHIDT